MKSMKFLGMGYIFGNTFDVWSHKKKIDLDDRDWETKWESPKITKDQIKQLKSMGFKTIKLPVTWHEHFTKQDDVWIMQEWWIERIKEVIDWVLEEDLYCIINTQHDADFINQGITDDIVEWFEALWSYLAEYFKDYSDHLLFESMNEVGVIEWDNHNEYDAVNFLNNLFIQSIRRIDVEHKRTLLVEGHYSDFVTTANYLEKYNDDNYAIAIHFYSPGNFTLESGSSASFSKKDLIDPLSKVYDIRRIHGADVVITECACIMDGHDQDKVLNWYKILLQFCKNNGIAVDLWANARNNEAIIDRKNMTFLLNGAENLIKDYNVKINS
jgi:endoglucanase